MQDRDLFDLFLAQNMQAIVQAQSRYGAYCRMIAQGILCDTQQIDACINESWSLAWELVPEQTPEHLKLFIGNITRKSCLAQLEKTPESASAELAAVLCEIGELVSDEADPSAWITDEKFCRTMKTFLEGLSEQDRCIFVRRYYFAESVERIALRCNVSVAYAQQLLFGLRAALHNSFGRKVCMHELSALMLIGEIDPALIEQSEHYKPTRHRPKTRRRPKKWLIGLITAAALIVILIPLSIVSVWQLDAYVQYEYPAYSGTLPSALDYLLTQDTNLVSSLLSEQNREALHQKLSVIAEQSRGAQIVLHGSEGLRFESQGNGTCVVKSGKACADSHVLVPMISPDGELVVGIDLEAFSQNSNVVEVTLPLSVAWIGSYAFRACRNLTEVHMSGGLFEIAPYAFQNCRSLTSLHVPAGVFIVGKGITDGCTSLESITSDSFSLFYYTEGNCLIETFGGSLVTGCKQSVIPSGVSSIEAGAFANMKGLTSLEIPEGVTHIRDQAFENCVDLQELTMPKSLTFVGKSAFMGCESLECVHFSQGISHIGESAFENCSSLVSVALPPSMTYIGSSAFENCDSLVSVTLPQSVETLEGMVFADCDALTSIEIPNGWVSVSSGMFLGCDLLSDVSLGDGVERIGISTFMDCKSLAEINIPKSVKTIAMQAFCGCALTEIRVPEGVEEIAREAFSNNGQLNFVSLPRSLYSFSSSAVNGCTNLTEIYYAGPEDIWRNTVNIWSDDDRLHELQIHCNHHPDTQS